MKKATITLIAIMPLLGGAELWGQQPVKALSATVAVSVATKPAPEPTAGTLTMVVNRARILGDKVDGAGTRYFAVRDSDLAGKTPAQVAERLAPAEVTPQQNVKTLDIVVALDHPLFVNTAGKEPFAIGTAILDGEMGNLRVNSNIHLPEVKITRRD
jgi:hypothetical protein